MTSEQSLAASSTSFSVTIATVNIPMKNLQNLKIWQQKC